MGIILFSYKKEKKEVIPSCPQTSVINAVASSVFQNKLESQSNRPPISA
jgi:hypothetical protein